jgi:hypothetical protein
MAVASKEPAHAQEANVDEDGMNEHDATEMLDEEEFGRAEAFVLAKLAELAEPVSPRDLLESSEQEPFSLSVLRQSLWRLIDNGLLELLPDWRIRRRAA